MSAADLLRIAVSVAGTAIFWLLVYAGVVSALFRISGLRKKLPPVRLPLKEATPPAGGPYRSPAPREDARELVDAVFPPPRPSRLRRLASWLWARRPGRAERLRRAKEWADYLVELEVYEKVRLPAYRAALEVWRATGVSADGALLSIREAVRHSTRKPVYPIAPLPPPRIVHE